MPDPGEADDALLELADERAAVGQPLAVEGPAEPLEELGAVDAVGPPHEERLVESGGAAEECEVG